MHETEKRGLYYRDLTVANIRPDEKADSIEIVFLESARFFRLPKGSDNYEVMLGKLQHALSNGLPARIGFASIESDTIEKVE